MTEFYKTIVDALPIGFAHCKMLFNDQGRPVDYIYKEMTPLYEKMTKTNGQSLIGQRGSASKSSIDSLVLSFLQESTMDINQGSYDLHLTTQGNEDEVRCRFLGKGYFIIEVKRLKEAVENPYEEIFEASPIAMASVSLEGNLHDVNELFCDLLGYNRDELSQMKFEELTYYEDRDISAEALERLIKEEEQVVTLEKRYIKKNKNLIWVQITGRLLRNEQGLPTKVVMTMRDMTEQKLIEGQLVDSEEKYKALFNRAPLGYQSLDENGHLLEMNEQWLQILGYKREEVMGKWFGDFIAPPYLERFKERFPQFKKQGFIHSEFEMLHKDGSHIYISFDGKIGHQPDGSFKQTHCILKDITIERRLEVELTEYRYLMKSLMDNTPDIIYIKDTHGKYLLFNKAAEKTSGKNADDILGKGVDAVFPPPIAEKVMAKDQEVLEKKEVITSEELILDADKVFNTYSSTKGPIFDENNVLLGMFGISRDITERIASEKALRDREKKYRLITENVVDVISVYNIDQEAFVFVSPSVINLRGYNVEEAMAQDIKEVIVPESFDSFIRDMYRNYQTFKQAQNDHNHFNNEVQLIHKDGGKLWVEISTRFQCLESGDIEAISVIRSIEERKKNEKMMRRLSYYDQLTGLYNRRYYEEELKRLDTERNLPIALIMVDLNGLKLTNDAFGHLEGDLRLKKTANVLRKGCRSDEIISRIGGDEFVVLLPKTNKEEAQRVIERINRVVSKEKVKHGLLSLSIGYAVKETINERMHEVFKKAEDDMYRHKLAESSSMRSKTINLIMNSLYEKSKREMHHSKRVSMICKRLATVMGFSQEEINQAEIAGLVHDIGKIGINNNILDKEGKLTAEEWEEVKKHCAVGYRILSSVNEFSEIAEHVLSHQERWDGKGYPQGLKGTAIPIQSRIIAVADAFDAMTSDRTYRSAMTEAEAIEEIKRCAGKQFDPEIADIFIGKALPQLKKV